MGKYAMTRQFNRASNNDYLDIQYDKKWIYAMSGVPVVGDMWRASDNLRYMDDYLRNRNMTWNDVKYPTRIGGNGSLSFMPDYAVKAIEKLYY